MFKAVCLLKRRPGMSFEDFVDYYENHHAKLAAKWVPTQRQYHRRYIRPTVNPITGEAVELDYDVITEMWFENEAAFRDAMAVLSSPEAQAEIVADEERLFDRSKICFGTLDEHVTEFPPRA